MLFLRLLTSLIVVFSTMTSAIHANKPQQTIAVSCSKQRMPVQRDKWIPLMAKMHVYARMRGLNGFDIEMDQAGVAAMLDRLPGTRAPGWTGEKALFRSRLRAADTRRPIRMGDLLHADERLKNLPKQGPATHRHVEIASLWMEMFVLGLANGRARVVDTTGEHALGRIRVRAYGSRTPLATDPAHWVEGMLFTADGRTVYDYCLVGPVAAPRGRKQSTRTNAPKARR